MEQEGERLIINTGDGNLSNRHKIEVTVYGVYLDPPAANQPNLHYAGRGTHGDYIRLHGLRFQRIREVLSYGGFHCLEDCAIEKAGGSFA